MSPDEIKWQQCSFVEAKIKGFLVLTLGEIQNSESAAANWRGGSVGETKSDSPNWGHERETNSLSSLYREKIYRSYKMWSHVSSEWNTFRGKKKSSWLIRIRKNDVNKINRDLAVKCETANRNFNCPGMCKIMRFVKKRRVATGEYSVVTIGCQRRQCRIEGDLISGRTHFFLRYGYRFCGCTWRWSTWQRSSQIPLFESAWKGARFWARF